MNIDFGLYVGLGLAAWVCRLFRRFFDTSNRLPAWDNSIKQSWWAIWLIFLAASLITKADDDSLGNWYLFTIGAFLMAMLWLMRDYRPARTLLIALGPFMFCFLVGNIIELIGKEAIKRTDDILGTSFVFASLWYIAFNYFAYNQKKALEKDRLRHEEEEKAKRVIEAQNSELESLVAARTVEITRQKEALEQTLSELRATQSQLIQSEKMASLGELTAGIAHEIQNPLNFVNNFSEVSVELIDELREERDKGTGRDEDLEAEILGDLRQNLLKITHHGGRAASIVKGMLQHSRTSSGQREPTDLNALADEYLRLAYHGLRAKDKTFNATFITQFDETLKPILVVPQDLGRVLLNLITNAFYAVQERNTTELSATAGSSVGKTVYHPTVTVSTAKDNNVVEIRVSDNGTGMPEAIREKVFQPFFTTKPTGQGTGLGLSLAYDIVTKGHGGEIAVNSTEGAGTEFIVKLPMAS